MTQTRLYLFWFYSVHIAVLISNQIVEIQLSSGKARKSLREEKVVSCHWILLFIFFLCSLKCQSDKSGIWKPYRREASTCCGRFVPTVHQNSYQPTPRLRCCATYHWDARHWPALLVIFSHSFRFSRDPSDIKIKWQNKPISWVATAWEHDYVYCMSFWQGLSHKAKDW